MFDFRPQRIHAMHRAIVKLKEELATKKAKVPIANAKAKSSKARYKELEYDNDAQR